MSLKLTLIKVGRALISRPVMITLGAIAIALLIWFGGPLVAIAGHEPLATAMARIGLLLALALWWALSLLWKLWRERRHGAALVAEISRSDSNDSGDEAGRRELELLRERMQKALAVLRGGRFGKGRSVYQLPWYLLVGPPGAGKTTLLQNSGLEFPLAEQFGPDAIGGVGGTRNCDWWFTNKAVLIDSAGRYTTQDSHQRQDSKAWLGFLGLLRKYRPHRPLNGVMVSMSMTDLIVQTKTERRLHARAIKQRIGEVQNQLGVKLPVYVILTKADLVSGFREYFGDLSREEREQVWGVTLPLEAEDSEKGVVGSFNREFHALVARIYERLFDRLQQEGDAERRSRIYEFPKQLRLLQSAADDFLKEIFAPNAFEDVPLLRGVYLASATQEGVPIDRVMQTVAGGFGLAEPRQARHSGDGRGYFIRRLLDEVVFSEQALASVNRHQIDHNRWLLRGVAAATALALGLSGWAWWNSYQWNLRLVDAVATATSDVAGREPEEVSGLDLLGLAELLTDLRDLPTGASGQLPEEPVAGFGLDQQDKLGQAANAAYDRGLRAYLLPYLQRALVRDMTVNSQYLDYLYETLKTYLMLGDRDRYQAEQVTSWFALHLERQLPGNLNSGVREALMTHLQTLLERGVFDEALDDEAIANARQLLTAIPLADRAYQRIKQEYLHSHIPDFRLTDQLGNDSIRVFARHSGAGLNQGIPGLYTYNGFHGIFLGENERLVKRLTADSWVYGEEMAQLDETAQEQIQDQVLQRYLNDYIEYWDSFVADLQLRDIADADNGAWLVKVLTGPEQPLQGLWGALRKNLVLSRPPMADDAEKGLELAQEAGSKVRQSQVNRLSQLLPDEMPDLPPAPGVEVEQAFAALLKVTDADIDQLLAALRTNGQQLDKMAKAGGDRRIAFQLQASDEAREATEQLHDLQRSLPQPLSSWIGNLAQETSSLTQAGAQQHLNDIWQATVYAEYQRALAGRYPLHRDAQQEATLKDFGQFFGYGGTLDTFFNEYLAANVNTRARRWTLDRNIGVKADSLALFQQAEQIRRLYFAPGSKTPQVHFGMRPIYLDEHVRQLMVSVDGQEFIYRHGPPAVTKLVWPNIGKNGQTRILLTPIGGERSVNTSYNGDWSLFRLIDQVTQERPATAQDKELWIEIAGRRTKIELLPDSVNHPFWSSLLEKFECPRRL